MLLACALVAMAASVGAAGQAPPVVRIGAIYPITGPQSATGLDLSNALRLAQEIINGSYPDLKLPLAAEPGLPKLGGARIELVFGDSQGRPQLGLSEAERLITQARVVALIGAYNSNVTATASQVAERYGIPFVSATSTSPSLHRRGFRWFFRTTPHDETFSENFFQFLESLRQRGILDRKPRIAILYENTLFGQDNDRYVRQFAQQYGYPVVAEVAYPANSTNLTSEVQRLKASGAEVVIQASYVSDAILSVRTYKELDFNPLAIIAQDAGFVDPEFLATLGRDADYIFTREVWALDLGGRKPDLVKVNRMFRERFGTDMNGSSAREFTGLLVLADAINRAGSTEPEAIRRALAQTHIPGDQLIMPWEGVRFDDTGQNVLGRGIMVQVQDGRYVTVWPESVAAGSVRWPMPPWSRR